MEEAVENLTLEELKERFRSLLEITKCAVCLESVRQDMVQCVNGHLLCSDCKSDLKICPTCRDKFSSSKPSQFVSQVIGILPTCCKYRNCPTILRNNDDHEKYCGFKPTQCKLCSWKGLGKDIQLHCENKHGNSSRDIGVRKLSKFDIDHEFSFFRTIIVFHENLFFWEQTINDPYREMFTVMWHIVPNGKRIDKFVIGLEFESESGYSSRTTIKHNLDPDAQWEDNSISVPHKLLSHFIDEYSDLNYYIFDL